jgi:UDP-N-acetyl-D-mannosaminuronate dehydrogenase
MSKIYRSLMVLAVITLIIVGLNTSSQGTSSLTAEVKKPVVGLQIENHKINVYALGEQYHLSLQEISQESFGLLHNTRLQFNAFINYLKKIWTIFHVLFLK